MRAPQGGAAFRSRLPRRVARLDALRRYVVGWLNYFGYRRSYTQLRELDQWLRRRVRLCYWKDWKRPRTRRHAQPAQRGRHIFPFAGVLPRDPALVLEYCRLNL